jgi:hypothetical protein
LKKNRIFAKIIEAKRNKTYVPPKQNYPKKTQQELLPSSCNSLADMRVALQSDYLDVPKPD